MKRKRVESKRHTGLRAPHVVGLAALAVLAVAAAIHFGSPPAPEVPDVDRDRLEPAVAEKIQNFRSGVYDAPESPDAWGDLGVVLHAHGLEEEAAVCYRKALELDASDFRWHYLLVHALLHFDRDAAKAQTAKALEVSNDYPALYVVRAEMLEEDGAIDDAKALYVRALELDPGNASGELALGRMAMADGDLDSARSHLERASELSPDAGPVYAALARLYRRLGERDKAVAAAQRVTTAVESLPVTDPIHVQMIRESVTSTSLLGRAQDLAEAGRLDEAAAAFRELVALRPDDAAMRVRLADVRLRQERDAEAEEQYRAALAIKSDDAGAHAGLAAVLGRRGAYDEAVSHFEASLVTRDDHVPTLVSYASILAFRGRGDEAIALYQRAIELEPDDVSSRRALAEFFFRSNRYREAAEHYRRVLELAPELGIVHLQLAASLAATGEYADANVHLDRARELGQTIPDVVRQRVDEGLARSP